MSNVQWNQGIVVGGCIQGRQICINVMVVKDDEGLEGIVLFNESGYTNM